MIKKINISIFIFIIHISVYSNKLISGTVLDCKTNLPLPGAEIIFDKNSSNSELVLSNFDGYFELEISETEPGFKGDTSTNTQKEATLVNGVEIKVPRFGEPGDIVKVDTRNCEYQNRVK